VTGREAFGFLEKLGMLRSPLCFIESSRASLSLVAGGCPTLFNSEIVHRLCCLIISICSMTRNHLDPRQ
jgi:hypothetical protein